MPNKKQIAEEKFLAGFNCAQAVFSVFADDLGLEEEEVLKVSSGFGAGMGRMQNTCGAVTGAFMVISYLNGNYKEGDNESKEKTYKLVREFAEDFKKIHGTIDCRELMDCDLSTEEGKEKAEKNNLFEERCLKYIRSVVELLRKYSRKKANNEV